MTEKNYIKSILDNIKSNYIRMIIGAVLSFISSIIFARGLGPDKYGIYTYIIWLTGTITCLCGFGIEGTLTKFLPQYYFGDDIEESGLLLRKVLSLQIKLISLISILLIATIPLWKGIVKESTPNLELLLVIGILTVLPTIISSILVNSIQALQKFDVYAKVTIKAQIITFIVNTIIILVFKKVEYVLIVLGLSVIYQLVLYYKEIKKVFAIKIKDVFVDKLKLKESARVRKYAAYMYINIVWQQIVWTRSEYFFLALYCNASQIAMYGLAYSLVTMGSMLFSPFMAVVNNYFSELVAKGERELLDKIISVATKYFSVLLLFILTCAFAFSDIVIQFLYTNKYNEVVSLFLIMLTGFVLQQILSVAGSLPFYYEKQKLVICVGIIAGVLNIVLDIVLIPQIGALGAAIANTTAQVFCAIIVFLYIVKFLDFKFNLRKVIPIFLLSAISILVLLLTSNALYRIIIFFAYSGLYIVLLYFFRIVRVYEIKSILRKGE